MRVHITDIYTNTREVEFPAECPKCGFRIEEGAHLTCMQYTYEEQGCTIRKEDDAELLDDWGSVEAFGEAQLITGFKCANCDTPLVQAEEEELPDGPQVMPVDQKEAKRNEEADDDDHGAADRMQ